MRILFIGAVRFSANMLETLIDMKASVVGVCTLADASFNADHFDLTEIASTAGIPSRYTPDINSEDTIAWIRSHSPDVVFCFGWSRLVKQPLLNLAPLGVIGFHPTALPANRGRHPLIWALALGLKETGSTFFFMDENADSGDILSQSEVAILDTDDAGSLYERISSVAREQLKELVASLELGQYTRIPQDEAASNYWRKRSRLDGQIDWRMTAHSIHNLVRALSRPYPGAHFIHNGQEIKVWQSEVISEPRNNIEPGKVLEVAAGSVTVKAGSDAVRLVEIKPEIDWTACDYV